MDKNTISKINEVINQIKIKYPDLTIDYEYNNDSECYEIWHDNEYLEYNDEEFRTFTGNLLYEHLLNCGIINVYITYSYINSQLKYDRKDNEFQKISVNYHDYGIIEKPVKIKMNNLEKCSFISNNTIQEDLEMKPNLVIRNKNNKYESIYNKVA